MNLADLAGPGRTPACWEKPNLFSAPALDYDPKDEIHAHLDADGHAALVEAKATAEAAAVDQCFGCPLMMACESIDDENMTNGQFIGGVIAGRTESERRTRYNTITGVADRPKTSKTTSVPNPQIAPGDRGPRGQVDDELIATMSIAGKTSEEIARDLNCSVRTVSRSRKRTEAITAKTTTKAPAPLTTFTAHAVAEAANTVAQSEKATATAKARRNQPKTTTKTTTKRPQRTKATHDTAPFFGGRRVSAPMEAVYNHLATVGGTDHLDNLISVAIPHVDPTEAISWWTTNNSITDASGNKVLRANKGNVPLTDRIREGARAKVFNAISATHRKGRYLDRDGDMFSLKAEALTAWNQRMHANADLAHTA